MSVCAATAPAAPEPTMTTSNASSIERVERLAVDDGAFGQILVGVVRLMLRGHAAAWSRSLCERLGP